MRGVADVVALGTGDFGEARLDGGDDFFGIIDGERGLRDVGKLCRVFDSKLLNVGDGFDKVHVLWALPHGSLDFRVPFVADHDDLAALLAHLADFDVNLGD